MLQFSNNVGVVLEQCHAVGLRLSLVLYAVLVVVAPVGRRSCGFYSKMASPNIGLC
jgi:hypothetical protein